jgi:hypothetical protein
MDFASMAHFFASSESFPHFSIALAFPFSSMSRISGGAIAFVCSNSSSQLGAFLLHAVVNDIESTIANIIFFMVSLLEANHVQRECRRAIDSFRSVAAQARCRRWQHCQAWHEHYAR